MAGNEEWRRLYQYDIPVFHLNGKYLMKHRVDREKLRIALQQSRGGRSLATLLKTHIYNPSTN